MKKIFILFLILLSSCSLKEQTMPTDFQIVYKWTSGAIEDPYTITTTFSANTMEGEIVFNHDNLPPAWIERFSVEKKYLEDMYARCNDAGIFNTNLEQDPDYPDGGATQSMLIIAYGQEYRVPYNFVADKKQEEAIYSLYDDIDALAFQGMLENSSTQH